MKKIGLSHIVSVFIVVLVLISSVLFFLNPGFVVKLIGVYSLYYIIPLSFFLLAIDFIFNHKLEKKYLIYGLILTIILLTISLSLRYWVASSFHIFP